MEIHISIKKIESIISIIKSSKNITATYWLSRVTNQQESKCKSNTKITNAFNNKEAALISWSLKRAATHRLQEVS